MKSKSLYPNTLFHFCKSRSALFGILQDTFCVSYAREKIIGTVRTREIGVPMVSFCDIKLSEVSDHMEKYGNYGIGLSKDWANMHGLNPVLYINRYSEFTNNLLNGLATIHRNMRRNRRNSINESESEEYANIYNIYRYTKNYEAPLQRLNQPPNENYRFADEREWRYVPPLDTPGIIPFVSANRIKTKALKDNLNDSIRNVRLHFEPRDIKYIIVDSEEEILQLIRHLSDVKSRFDNNQLDVLKTRIITSEQIFSDF